MTSVSASRAPASRAKPKQGEPWGPIAARVSAVFFGGYALVYWAGAAAAKLLPLQPSESVYLVSTLQIVLYVGVVIWTFAVSGRTAWITLIGLSALFFAIARFI